MSRALHPKPDVERTDFMSQKLTVAQHQRRWKRWTAGLFIIAALAIAVIAVARRDLIDPHPWGYVALAAGVTSALAGLAFAFAMAAIESRGD